MDSTVEGRLGTGCPRPERIDQWAEPLPFTAEDLQPVLRNVRIDGQRTSIRLEAAFWAALDRQLMTECRGLNALIADLRTQLHGNGIPGVSLASALRVLVVKLIQDQRGTSARD
jgi:predicted DNA-binding ribbon-helix-helix protein